MSDSAAPHVPAGARRRLPLAGGAVLVAGILLLGLNLRAAITSLPPIFPELAGALSLSPAAISALAAVPVLCFAVFSPVAAPLSRRFGEERVLLAALVLLAGGLALRGALPGGLLFPGTVIATGAIALMNVLLPSLVKRRAPARAGLLIGAYLMSLSAGAILGSLLAVPVFRSSHGSVPIALGLWALPAAAAALLWLPQARFGIRPAEPGQVRRSRIADLGRHRLTWQVTFFMGLQSLIYYATLSWLPTMFRDRGVSPVHAGDLLALMNFGNAVTALLIPVLAHRVRDQRLLTSLTVTVTMAGLAGASFAPAASAAVWVLLLGLGQGAGLGLAIYFTMARAPDPRVAASLSAFAQGGGYLVAAAGPLLVGFLHRATGGWTVPMTLLLAIGVAEFTAGWYAARDRVLHLTVTA